MYGAAILTVGVIIMKILGAIYKIPLGNILGDEGYSMFISAYSIYNIFFTLATAGLPVALSRLIAEADANGRAGQERRTFKVALVTFAVIGTVFGLIMFLFPEWLAEKYLENPDAALSIKAMSPAILLVCLVSAYRGYCQGNGNMIPTTIDEVLEVLFKVIFGLIISVLVLKAGKGLPSASAGAIFGVTIGGIVSLLFMIFYKKKNYDALAAPYTGGRDVNDVPEDDELVDPKHKIALNLLKIGIPIALGASIMAILNSVDSKLCMNRLQSAAGFSYQQAKVLYGIYGKAQTLFNLPAALTQPLNISVVPAIAAAIVLKKKGEADKVSEDSLRITAVVAMPMAAGLAVLSFPIINLLYPNSHEAGPVLLRTMAVCSFFVCMVLMQNAILQAGGKERLPMYSMITGSVVKIIVNWFLIANPAINILGAPIGTMCGYITMTVMNHIFIRKAAGIKINVFRIVFRPLMCALIMSAVTALIYKLIPSTPGMLAAMLSAVVVYVASVVLLRAITIEDLKLIPGGAKIGKILHMH